MSDNRTATADDGKIGRLIRKRREALGLSQTELGQAVGVTFAQIQKYEAGKNRVAASRLAALAAALRVPQLHFYQGHEPAALSDEAMRLATAVDNLRSTHRAAVLALAEALLRDEEQHLSAVDLGVESQQAEPLPGRSPG